MTAPSSASSGTSAEVDPCWRRLYAIRRHAHRGDTLTLASLAREDIPLLVGTVTTVLALHQPIRPLGEAERCAEDGQPFPCRTRLAAARRLAGDDC
jgi:hypothetical protein